MSSPIGTSRSLVAGLVASVVFHGGLALTIAQYGDRFVSIQKPSTIESASIELPLPKDEAERPPLDDAKIKRLQLGIEKSSVVTETWLGFADPTEHSAPLATVEQAAMAMNRAGNPGPDEPGDAASEAPVEAEHAEKTPAHASPPAEPAPAELPSPQPVLPPPTEPVVSVQSPGAEPSGVKGEPMADAQPASFGSIAADPMPPDSELAVPAFPVPESAPSEAAPEKPAPERTPTVDPLIQSPAASTPEAVAVRSVQSPVPQPSANFEEVKKLPKPRRVSGDRPGVLSDRESVAAALKEVVEVRLGKPAAAEGLEIKTTNPRWSVTTQLTASPKNPVVWIAFGRDGKVIDADFLNGENTGWTAVDEPLLHAIFAWRAKGAALEELPTNDAQAAVRVILRITLRGA